MPAMILCFRSFLYPPAPNSSFEHPMPGSDRYSDYMEDLYTKPWCRLGAYLVGMVTGYIIHAYKIQMPKVRAWIVTIRRKNRETVILKTRRFDNIDSAVLISNVNKAV